ncbi:MAG TPA: ParB/RepB/Spo0J family partition protein [Phycisphaerae bacterium]|jgi:ParB family chromosome partitioning protein|nr:ParB/RepB/Spo0J family partition protein [Phycisphaerae bacterium]HOB75933.1 ParB/RepB/Spo0J family partition protein [Phycisphaerae bacterium]HOJ55539.1 ParB/RepB/Spo0J family partition protein [Phycisphaerae bacterium]HOL27571.1 ParB/RepB/Spo0J family partition protein [Phycisphaerae bacterium]HPP21813.1 ParB/RepB/Spo0J family partition protein [Phycisphaerae bacterium]
MQQPQKRLGRGLKALISVGDALPEPQSTTQASAAPEAPPRATFTVPVGQLRPNPFQPRRDMPPEHLKALADSIRKSGVIQPILVRQTGEQLYEIIAGERRWRAAQQAGLKEVPVVLREADDREVLELALVENIFREDLNAIDRALAYRRYCDEFALSAEEVAERLGEDRSTVANYLRLLDLPSDVKQWVAEGKLAMGHARCLLGLRSPSEITQAAKRVIEEDLSVRATEKLVRDRLRARSEAARGSEKTDAKRAQIRRLEESFTRALGTKVEIHEAARKGKGRILIHYFSLDDFDRILERLGLEGEAH